MSSHQDFYSHDFDNITWRFVLYCNSNAESGDDEVSVDSIASTDMEEYTSSLSENLSIHKDDIDAYLEAVESNYDIFSNSESHSSSDGGSAIMSLVILASGMPSWKVPKQAPKMDPYCRESENEIIIKK
jgi:hypothetical protein